MLKDKAEGALIINDMQEWYIWFMVIKSEEYHGWMVSQGMEGN